MNDAEDNYSLLPTELDLNRLEDVDLAGEGRVESENEVWVAIRYPVSPEKAKSWKWCAWSLIVNCPQLPAKGGTFEFKNRKSLVLYLEQLEGERKSKEDA